MKNKQKLELNFHYLSSTMAQASSLVPIN